MKTLRHTESTPIALALMLTDSNIPFPERAQAARYLRHASCASYVEALMLAILTQE